MLQQSHSNTTMSYKQSDYKDPNTMPNGLISANSHSNAVKAARHKISLVQQ